MTRRFCRAVTRISHENFRNINKGAQDVLLLGILRAWPAPCENDPRTISKRIEGVSLPFGSLDIRYYRDDLTLEQDDPRVRLPSLSFDIQDKNRLLLVDDVIYTGTHGARSD